MKVNIEIDLGDILNDDGTLDSSIETEVINKISSSIATNFPREYQKKLEEKAHNMIETMMDDAVAKSELIVTKRGSYNETETITFVEALSREFEKQMADFIKSSYNDRDTTTANAVVRKLVANKFDYYKREMDSVVDNAMKEMVKKVTEQTAVKLLDALNKLSNKQS